MERFVRLGKLPSDFREFPADLRERIGYDPKTQRLWHRGFMSKTEYDRLFRLSGDLDYQRALQELFTMAVDTPESSRHWLRWLLVAGLVIVGAVVAWFARR